MGVACPASAQDYTSGALSITINNASGRPVSGASVKLTASATGVASTRTSSPTGEVHATGLPPGEYGITVSAPGFDRFDGLVTIVVGREASVAVKLTTGESVVVTAKRLKPEFTSTTTGISLDVERLAKEQPIVRSITAVSLLAPSVVKGVAGFGDVPSIAGSSVAENAFYVNGMNITNPDTYIGSAKVPFDFYKSVEVKTGGYAAEFGRATGGVVNAVTKSGSNQFTFGVHDNYAPISFAESSPNTFSTDNKLSKGDSHEFSVEAGGPIIKDRLFAYGLYQWNDETSRLASITGSRYTTSHDKDPFYGLKLDGYVTPDHHLEFTYFTTKTDTAVNAYKFTPATETIGAFTGHEIQRSGGDNWVAKYTGKVTDWLTVSAVYGQNKDASDTLPDSTSAYYVLDTRSGTAKVISTTQPYSGSELDDTDRKFWRADGDINVQIFGRHHFRFGIDHEDLKEVKVTALNGGLPMIYDYRPSGLRITYERLGGNVSAKDEAYYLQDSWDITKDLNLEIGVRDDTFQQSNLIGEKYLDFKGDWAPRVGFSWDPTGERKFRIYGNYGAYYIPPAMNLGFRGHDDYWREYFLAPDGSKTNFTIDPVTGLPAAVGAARTDLGGAGYGSTCPHDISAAPGHPVNGDGACLIFGGNVQDPAYAKVTPGTDATRENEFVLGASWKMNDLWTLSLSSTYRALKNVSEDTDFSPYLGNYWCGIDPNGKQCDFYSNNSAYYIWNPKPGSVTLVDWLDKTKTVTLTNANSSLPDFPKGKRIYRDLVFEFKRAFDGKWSLQGSVTVSKSFGNSEGTVKSDAGNGAQTDAGSTQDFDYIGLTQYSSGLLPNHHGYQFKVWGSYQVTNDLLVGANVRVISPLHGSCEGIAVGDQYAAGYGASSFFCGGNPSPRGTGWTSDWEKNVDVSLRYTVPTAFAPFGKAVLRADIFNAFNGQAVLQRYAQGDLGPTPTSGADPNYKAPTVYQTPRYVRIGFDWTY